MKRMLRWVPAGAALLLVLGCGKSTETSLLDFAEIYGKVAGILAEVEDEDSARAAAKRVDELAPAVLKVGTALGKSNGSGRVDASPEVMAAVAQAQQRASAQVRRLQGEDELWPLVRPSLEQAMLLQALAQPPR